MVKREYLITDVFKKLYKVNKKFFFIDEYLSRFYESDRKKKIKNYIFSLKSYSNINYSSKFVLKKITEYRNQLSKKLNSIHNKSYSKKYWGLVLDQFLYLLINNIYIETKILKKVFKEKKNLILNNEKFKNTYLDTSVFLLSRIQDNSQAYSRFAVAKKLGFTTKKFLKTKSKTLKNVPKNSFITKIFRKIIHFYIKIFNPIVLIDCYFGKKNSFKILLSSYGKILPVSHLIFFNNKPFQVKKNKKKRKEIFIKERDYFDELFNELFEKFLPLSYLENYSYYEKFSEKFKNIKKIGTAVHLIYNDEFKFLAAKILENNGKVYSFPHGGLLGQKKYSYDQIIESKYATRVFRWHDKYPLNQNQLSKLTPYKLENIKKNQQILFYPTSVSIKSNYKIPLLRKYHPYCNFFYDLYDNLKLDLKEKVKLKPFPHFTSKYLESNWKKIYNKNIFLKKNTLMFNNSKIVIIDDYSTPICELLHTGTPFLILDPEKKNLKPEILKKFKKLKKLNILFENPKKISNFLNKNYDKIDIWWPKVLKSGIYLDLKKNLIPGNNKKLNLKDALA